MRYRHNDGWMMTTYNICCCIGFMFMFVSWVEPWMPCFFQNHAERMKKVYHPLRAALSFHSKVSVGHLFAAREDLSKIHRTSSGKIREKTACAINKVKNNPILCLFLIY